MQVLRKAKATLPYVLMAWLLGMLLWDHGMKIALAIAVFLFAIWWVFGSD